MEAEMGRLQFKTSLGSVCEKIIYNYEANDEKKKNIFLLTSESKARMSTLLTLIQHHTRNPKW
jgi:hypothetical protein